MDIKTSRKSIKNDYRNYKRLINTATFKALKWNVSASGILDSIKSNYRTEAKEIVCYEERNNKFCSAIGLSPCEYYHSVRVLNVCMTIGDDAKQYQLIATKDLLFNDDLDIEDDDEDDDNNHRIDFKEYKDKLAKNDLYIVCMNVSEDQYGYLETELQFIVGSAEIEKDLRRLDTMMHRINKYNEILFKGIDD